MTLREAATAQRVGLERFVTEEWGAESIEYAQPDSWEGDEAEGMALPRAYVLLVSQASATGDPRLSRCGGATLVWELHFRECHPKASTGQIDTLEAANLRLIRSEQVRRFIALGTLPGAEAIRWGGDVFLPQSTDSDISPGADTIRTAVRFEVLTEADDIAYF